MKYRPSRRTRRMAISTAVVLALSGANGPWLYRFGSERYHAYTIDKPEYKAANGHWDFLDVPSEFRINTIHAALLHTGKVLLVAGSGNNQKNFDAKSFRSVLWDPGADTFKNIPTPKDMFCSGHTQLPDGKLLIAGGTKRYEKLEGDVTKAGGLMIVHNENPDKPITLPAGTRFTGKGNGKTFVSKDPVLVEKATKVFDKRTGAFLHNEPGLGRIYVEAQQAGTEYETGTQDNYRVSGLSGSDTRNVYGIAQKLALDKKDFQGIREAYEFDPVAEKYITVDPMNEARWYPTLTTLQDGKVLALSGLDEIGQIVPGKDEIYDPKTRKWAYTGIVRKFPTYPAVFLLNDGKLFYSGSNAGYGPADIGRDPGIWDLATNRFKKIPGLSDADEMETSATVRLPPPRTRSSWSSAAAGSVSRRGPARSPGWWTSRTPTPNSRTARRSTRAPATRARHCCRTTRCWSPADPATTGGAAARTSSRRGCTTRRRTATSGSRTRRWAATTTRGPYCSPTAAS